MPLDAYARFVSDGQGHLRRYLFDSNVRDYLGSSSVNQDIAQTLADADSPEFWWLNNGVTVLATQAIPLGKTSSGNAIQLHDVQIVNGLQTTQSIYNHFTANGTTAGNARVLVKVIVSDDPAIRKKIIRATNNQSSVELASLTATDKIQRDIEDILLRHEWYYERRRNYYKNVDKPRERFVDPLFLAVAVVALVRKAPHSASRLKTRFMRDSESYLSVFSDRLPILIWPKLVSIMKQVDVAIAGQLPRRKSENRLRAGWRGAVALASVAEMLGSFDYSIADLVKLDETRLTRERISEIFDLLYSGDLFIEKDGDHVAFQRGRIDLRSVSFGRKNSIAGIEVIGRWEMPGSFTRPKLSGRDQRGVKTSATSAKPITTFELESVASRVPPQPWPKGLQQKVAEETNLPLSVVRRAIKQLIAAGRFGNQWDGVVVNADGVITAVDIGRADPRHVVGEIFVRTRPAESQSMGEQGST